MNTSDTDKKSVIVETQRNRTEAIASVTTTPGDLDVRSSIISRNFLDQLRKRKVKYPNNRVKLSEKVQ